MFRASTCRTSRHGGECGRVKNQWRIYQFRGMCRQGYTARALKRTNVARLPPCSVAKSKSSGFLWILAKLDPLITRASRDIWRPPRSIFGFIFLSHRVLDTPYQRIDFRDFLHFFEFLGGFGIQSLDLQNGSLGRRASTSAFLVGHSSGELCN